MRDDKNISSGKSARIAKNTVFLYIRMLALIIVGFYSSRVVLRALGFVDYGIFNAVGSVVTLSTILTTSVTNAIMRYMSFALGENDKEKLRNVFSSSVIIQLMMCAVVILAVETAGLWYLNNAMKIPPSRLGAANWVLQCSTGVLCLSILSIPFNALILSREKMSAFAFISLGEAGLKLAVALSLTCPVPDKLKLYSVLLLMVAIIVRMTYGLYCRKHFEESRGRLRLDKSLLREMLGFAGWNIMSTSTSMLTTSGVNILVPQFYDFVVSAARGISTQVEGIVRQFASNFLMALNPQLIKSYADGDKEYSFELTRKGVKIAYLLILLFVVPIVLDCDYLLGLWLKEVPPLAPSFLRVALLAILVDLGFNSPRQLLIASGKVKRFFIAMGCVNLLCFAVSWALFAGGAPAISSYYALLCAQVVIDGVCLWLCSRQEGLQAWIFLKDVVFRLLALTALSFGISYLAWRAMPESFWRLAAVTVVSSLSTGAGAMSFVLDKGERAFVTNALLKFLKPSKTA